MTTVKMKGNEIHLKGSLPKIGDSAPSFILVDKELGEMTLDNFKGKKKLLNIFPSMDTQTCALSVRSFYTQCQKIPNLSVLNISMDLPFAAKKFCESQKIENAVTLSAFRSPFGDDYGVKIIDGPIRGLLSRAVIILSEDNRVEYVELVPEIVQEPNYQKAIEALGSLAKVK
jgi:thioredoxin-dependent peroxiredoxin